LRIAVRMKSVRFE
jgi:hypothetical protein